MEEGNSQTIMKRQTAYKVWIKQVHTTQNLIDEKTGLPYYALGEKHVVRVNIIGSIIDSFSSGGYGSLVIDDGSAQIRLKVWGEDLSLVEEKNIGDFVLVIGRIADFNDERYIRPEIVRGIGYDWALLRRVELIKAFGVPEKDEKVILQKEQGSLPEVEPSLAAREMILTLIDKREEISEEELFKSCSLPLDKVQIALYDLLKEGEIFSPKKGLYRLV
jgi:RPA family protein